MTLTLEEANEKIALLEKENSELKQGYKNMAILTRQYVNEFIDKFKDEYYEDIQPFLNKIKYDEGLTETIHTIIEKKLHSVVDKYVRELYEEDRNLMEQRFNQEVHKFIKIKNGINTSISGFVRRRIQSLMEGYKNDKLDEMIKMIYSRLSQKYNLIITKEITEKMTEMGTIQTQTISEVMRCIKAKELKYKELAVSEKKLLGVE